MSKKIQIKQIGASGSLSGSIPVSDGAGNFSMVPSTQIQAAADVDWVDAGNALYTTASVAIGTGSTVSAIGSDVFFFTSGNIGGKGTSGVAVLGGDTVISGTLYLEDEKRVLFGDGLDAAVFWDDDGSEALDLLGAPIPSLVISGSDATTAGSSGKGIVVVAGEGSGSGGGGAVILHGGGSDTGSTPGSGEIYAEAGTVASGTSSAVRIIGGGSTTATGSGGFVQIQGGDSGLSGSGGDVFVFGGPAGQTTLFQEEGGSIILKAGNGDLAGGNIFIGAGGDTDGANVPGAVYIGGSWEEAGSAGEDAGSVFIGVPVEVTRSAGSPQDMGAGIPLLTNQVLISANTVALTGSSVLSLSGSSIQVSGAMDLGGNQINNVADPTADQDVATKAYVDSVSADVSGSGTDNRLIRWDGANAGQDSNLVNDDSGNLYLTSDGGGVWGSSSLGYGRPTRLYVSESIHVGTGTTSITSDRIYWSSDGLGQIGFSSSSGRPDNVYVKTAVEVAGNTRIDSNAIKQISGSAGAFTIGAEEGSTSVDVGTGHDTSFIATAGNGGWLNLFAAAGANATTNSGGSVWIAAGGVLGATDAAAGDIFIIGGKTDDGPAGTPNGRVIITGGTGSLEPNVIIKGGSVRTAENVSLSVDLPGGDVIIEGGPRSGNDPFGKIRIGERETSEVLIGTGSAPGNDIFLYVSGNIGGKGTSGTSVFGGDVQVSGSFYAGTGGAAITPSSDGTFDVLVLRRQGDSAVRYLHIDINDGLVVSSSLP